jgi:hypothetical protein
MPTKPKAIDILSVQRTRKTICIHWKQGDGKFDLDERDNPLPAFGKAFDALVPIVAAVLHVPDTWESDLRVIGLKLGKQGGAATVQFICRKSIPDASKEFPFTTPYRLLAHPTEPGSYTPPLAEKDAAKVWDAVEQAKAYVRGDRAQGQIQFETDDDDADETPVDPAQGRLIEVPPAPAKRKRGQKSEPAAAK